MPKKVTTTVQANALDVLKEVMKTRNWYEGNISRTSAAEYKRNLPKGKVSYEKACELLNMIGYEKVEDEIWRRPPF